ncbi:L-aspartate oxidase [Candidatus Fermentibacteria bacterium]|nr:MAG: L-aspartate oxidase [Candidatus Fermentibacteria bacterium]
MMTRSTDILIIGGGMAGLTCALEIPSIYNVTILSKTELPTGSTFLAQGGLAAVTSPDDSFEQHLKDTQRAGAGLVDEAVAREIISAGPELITALEKWGITLEGSDGDGGGMEGGHSFRRVLHYFDQTGRFISEHLADRCRKRKNVTLIENAFAINLITASREALSLLTKGSDRCLGAYVLLDGKVRTFLARETILATGGAGKVYRYTSNQDFATGDGIAMAYRAGLTVRNMEFYQFHPTCLFHPEKRNFLITEALRGEGAQLKNEAGKRFMKYYDENRMELAPRDIVARAIDSEMKRYGTDHMLLDASHLTKDFLEDNFPEVTTGVLAVGIEPWNEPIPVVPAAHYCVGGVVASTDGSTEMTGLRVIGEAASTGFHGANRLGSNSLLEAGVMGIKAAEAIKNNIPDPIPEVNIRDWSYGRAEPLEESVLIDHSWASLRSVMWDYVGIVRTDKRLRRALKLIDVLSEEVEEDYWTLLPTREQLELRNLTAVARLIVRSALNRRESVGLHYLLDCPEPSHIKRDTLLRKDQ